jgi:hypothetical protein
MRTRIELCGVPIDLRRSAAARHLRKVALVCPDQVVAEIVKAAREDHRAATQPDRTFVRDLKAEGGVCAPADLSREEWRNALPRPLRGKWGHCLALDEVAQQLADRGAIADASSDAALDHMNATFNRARSKPTIPNLQALMKEARRVVADRVRRAVGELIATTRKQAEAGCPPHSDKERK